MPGKRAADKYLTNVNQDDDDSGDEDPGVFEQADAKTMAGRKVIKVKRRLGSVGRGVLEGSSGPPALQTHTHLYSSQTPAGGSGTFKGFSFGAKPAATSDAPPASSSPAVSAPSGFKAPAFGSGATGAGAPKLTFGAKSPTSSTSPAAPGATASLPAFGAGKAPSFGSGFKPSFGSGSAATTSTSSPSIPKFGASASGASGAPLKFGASAPSSTTGTGAPLKFGASATGGSSAPLTFGARPSTSTGTGTSTTSSGGTSLAGQFDALNKSFKAQIDRELASDAVVDLTPTLESYIGHAKKIYASQPKTLASASGTPFGGGSGFNKPAASTTLAAPKPAQSSPAAPAPAAAASSTASDSAAADAGADDDEDALYKCKAKLFFRKDGDWVERGVGTLALKSEGDRTMLTIRDLSSSRRYLINVFLQPQMNFMRSNSKKNNLLFSCVANPPVSPICSVCGKKHPRPQETNECINKCFSATGSTAEGKEGQKPDATSYLMRVKDADIADELEKKLNELKE